MWQNGTLDRLEGILLGIVIGMLLGGIATTNQWFLIFFVLSMLCLFGAMLARMVFIVRKGVM